MVQPVRIAPQPKQRNIPFSLLWENYPSDLPCLLPNGDPPQGLENQCAIKMSLCLERSGVRLVGLGNDCPVPGRPGKIMVAAAARLAGSLSIGFRAVFGARNTPGKTGAVGATSGPESYFLSTTGAERVSPLAPAPAITSIYGTARP
jgi:hypothetical protein